MCKRHESCLAVANLETKTVEVFPLETFEDAEYCPAEFDITPEGRLIVGVVYDPKPFKLGLQFCLNRRTKMYVLPLRFNRGEYVFFYSMHSIKS